MYIDDTDAIHIATMVAAVDKQLCKLESRISELEAEMARLRRAEIENAQPISPKVH